MTALRELVDAGDATFSVFSPDAVRSGLVQAIVAFIEKSTGAVPVRSFQVRHTGESIERFYIHRVADILPYWHLVSRLFQFGTSIGVVWIGSGVQEALSTLKGRSHPAEAAGGTIRRMYWCDNAVCNLLHVSDEPPDVERELQSIGQERLLAHDIPCPPAKTRIRTGRATRTQPQHCGTFMALTVAQRSLSAGSKGSAAWMPSVHDDARKVQELCRERLLQTADNDGLRGFVESYLSGDLDRMRAYAKRMTANRWEQFVLDCGCVGRKLWNRSDLRSTVQSVVEDLPVAGRWLISGSAAMCLHGFQIVPDDIDVWLDGHAFTEVVEKLRGEVREARLPHGRAYRMTLQRLGWKVEYTGPVVRPSGLEMTVDIEMMLRAHRRVQPIEDLVAELLVMKRPPPKRDLDRAHALYQQFRCQIDDTYLHHRLRRWREGSHESLLIQEE